MAEEEIWEIIRAFGDASRRAREAGLDAVQVHAAHAYLLSQFLSPFTNRRADQWAAIWKTVSASTVKSTGTYGQRRVTTIRCL